MECAKKCASMYEGIELIEGIELRGLLGSPSARPRFSLFKRAHDTARVYDAVRVYNAAHAGKNQVLHLVCLIKHYSNISTMYAGAIIGVRMHVPHIAEFRAMWTRVRPKEVAH